MLFKPYCSALRPLPLLLLLPVLPLLSPSATPFIGITASTGHGLRCSGLHPLSLALPCGSGFHASVLRACFGRHRLVACHLQPSPTPSLSLSLSWAGVRVSGLCV
uniref:Secreted protein n=1 Tax=Opuntia streptacantha TaxID=393608 RepID=A0A7C9CV72_OPUST